MTTQTPADNRQTPEQARAAIKERMMRDTNVCIANAVADSVMIGLRSCLPPQASTGREWELDVSFFDCRGNRTAVSYPKSYPLQDRMLLTPMGSWVSWGKWLGMQNPLFDSFRNIDDASAALSQAPDPRTPQASPASDKVKPTTLGILTHAKNWLVEIADYDTAAKVLALTKPPPPASEAERPTPADAGSVSVPREVRIDHADGWGLWVQVDKDGGQVMVRDQRGGKCIVLTTDEMQQLRAALSAPSPSLARDIIDQMDKELGRWQESIREEVVDAVQSLPPEHRREIDGGGCDSGDPLDLTLSEVRQGLNAFRDYIYERDQADPSPARAGFTYPDGAVEEALNEFQRYESTDDSIMSLNRAMSALRAARVTPQDLKSIKSPPPDSIPNPGSPTGDVVAGGY